MTSLSDYKGCGSLTREQFLFHESKVVAKLIADEGLTDEEIINKVVEENLFQFPTERIEYDAEFGYFEDD